MDQGQGELLGGWGQQVCRVCLGKICCTKGIVGREAQTLLSNSFRQDYLYPMEWLSFAILADNKEVL